MSKQVLLSDDEVVAAAVRMGKDWKTSLPTVSAQDPDDLLRAVARGTRSLYMRGMLTGPGNTDLAPEISALLSPAAGTLPEHLGYAATSAEPHAAAGLRFAIFESTNGNKVLIITLANGINEISEVPRGRAREFVAAFAGAPLREGADENAAVLLAPIGADAATFAVVTARGTRTGTLSIASPDFTSGQPTDTLPTTLIPQA